MDTEEVIDKLKQAKERFADYKIQALQGGYLKPDGNGGVVPATPSR